MASESIRIEGLAGVLDALKQLPAEIVSKSGGPVKLALRTGAAVLVDEAKRNVRAIIDTPNIGGNDESTWLLLASIRQTRSRPTAGQKGEAVVIGIKRGARYPSFRQNTAGNLTAVQIGRQLEFGTENREPMAWLRPAFDVKKGTAVDAFVADISKRTQEVIDRLSRQARRK